MKWFRNELKSWIADDLLADFYIRDQGIFDPDAIAALKTQLFSRNPGDIHARIWGLIVFQNWFTKWHLS